MSTSTEIKDDPSSPTVTISFGERFAASDQFDAIFKEGMALVERTASYLDGPGRKEARLLRGPVSVLYATESMRLTTRLLELASIRLRRPSGKSVKPLTCEGRPGARRRTRSRLTRASSAEISPAFSARRIISQEASSSRRVVRRMLSVA